MELAGPLERLAAEGRLKEVPGAGEAIMKKINELVATGKLGYYERLKAEFPGAGQSRRSRNAMKVKGMKVNGENRLVAAEAASPGDAEAISYFRQALTTGRPWYSSLLAAIGLWASAEEVYRDRAYQYLIDGEAFDWLLLAERLCEAADGLLPEDEKDDLLFRGVAPVEMTTAEVRGLIGDGKYRQYLNFFYGVTVEEALLLAVQAEVDKERRGRGFQGGKIRRTRSTCGFMAPPVMYC